MKLVSLANFMIFAAFIGSSLQAKQQSLKLILKQSEMRFDENVCNVTANHEMRSNEIYSVGFRMDLYIEVKSFFVKVSIALPTANGRYETLIKDSTTDVCRYLKTNNSNIIMRLFFNGHFGDQKFPMTCPVKPGIYYIENFRIKENMLTIRAVETKILLKVDFCIGLAYGKMHCILNIKFFGEVKDRNKWQQELDKDETFGRQI